MEIKKHKTVNLHNVHYDNDGYVMYNIGSIKEPVICIRPGHKTGLPIIYAEEKNGKIISHNYCHGGVGYAIIFGCIEKAIENFQKLRFEHRITFNDEITIVGLGCMGLVTALTLYFRGFKNVKLVGEKSDQTASMGAGGLIEFSLTTIFSPNQIEFMNEMFRHTFIEYQQIVKGEHKFIKYGLKEVDYYTDFYQEGAGLPHLAELKIIPPCKKVILQLDGAKPMQLFHFKTFHIVPNVFMSSLFYTIQKLGIPIEYKKINSFEEIKSRTIFNCTGLGSRELNKDQGCYPICGHGVILSEETYSEHDYILRLTEVNELKNIQTNTSLYFMPKVSGFIGGTYMKEYDGKDEKLNKEMITQLVERSKYVFNAISPNF